MWSKIYIKDGHYKVVFNCNKFETQIFNNKKQLNKIFPIYQLDYYAAIKYFQFISACILLAYRWRRNCQGYNKGSNRLSCTVLLTMLLTREIYDQKKIKGNTQKW